VHTSVILEQAISPKIRLEPWAMPEHIRDRFRALRAFLTASMRESQVVAVTSPSRGEGVSWVCSRLACALAESGRPTVLVDAHAAHPTQAGLFGIARKKATPAEDFRKWQVAPKLIIAEADPEGGLESLRSTISRLAFPGRTVLIDCPPLTAGAMAVELGAVVDGVLLVVEAGNQDRDVVAQTVLQVQRAGLRVMGAVLNKRRQYIPRLLNRSL